METTNIIDRLISLCYLNCANIRAYIRHEQLYLTNEETMSDIQINTYSSDAPNLNLKIHEFHEIHELEIAV